jgi:hypothetical protein
LSRVVLALETRRLKVKSITEHKNAGLSRTVDFLVEGLQKPCFLIAFDIFGQS